MIEHLDNMNNMQEIVYVEVPPPQGKFKLGSVVEEIIAIFI
jgi:hypothetical protein